MNLMQHEKHSFRNQHLVPMLIELMKLKANELLMRMR